MITVHNLAFQGHFPASLLAALKLPPQALAIDGVEYFGGIGFLKAGLQFADRITTVSPTYAAEIRTPEGGMALDGLLRVRSDVVSGILNGIDDRVWDPATDPHLAATFSRRPARPARLNKQALKQRFGITSDDGAPLFARDQPPLRAEGARSSPRSAAAAPVAWRRSRSRRHRRRRPRARLSRRRQRHRPGVSAFSSATTKRWRISCRAAPTRFWCRRASSLAG